MLPPFWLLVVWYVWFVTWRQHFLSYFLHFYYMTIFEEWLIKEQTRQCQPVLFQVRINFGNINLRLFAFNKNAPSARISLEADNVFSLAQGFIFALVVLIQPTIQRLTLRNGSQTRKEDVSKAEKEKGNILFHDLVHWNMKFIHGKKMNSLWQP